MTTNVYEPTKENFVRIQWQIKSTKYRKTSKENKSLKLLPVQESTVNSFIMHKKQIPFGLITNSSLLKIGNALERLYDSCP